MPPKASVKVTPKITSENKPKATVSNKPKTTTANGLKATTTNKSKLASDSGPKNVKTNGPKINTEDKPKRKYTRKTDVPQQNTTTDNSKINIKTKPYTDAENKPKRKYTRKTDVPQQSTTTDNPKINIKTKPEADVKDKPKRKYTRKTDAPQQTTNTDNPKINIKTKPEADVEDKPKRKYTRKAPVEDVSSNESKNNTSKANKNANDLTISNTTKCETKNVKDKLPCICVTSLAKCKTLSAERKLVQTFEPVVIERKGNETAVGITVEEIIAGKLGLCNDAPVIISSSLDKSIKQYVDFIKKVCGPEVERSKQISRKITSGVKTVGYISGKTDFQSDRVIVELKHANDNINHYKQASIYGVSAPGVKIYLVNTLLGQIYQIQKGNTGNAKLNITARAMSLLHNKIVVDKRRPGDVANPLIISYSVKDQNNLVGAIVYDTVENIIVDIYDNTAFDVRKFAHFKTWLSQHNGKIITWDKNKFSKNGVVCLSENFENQKLTEVIDSSYPSNNFCIKNNVIDTSIATVLAWYVRS